MSTESTKVQLYDVETNVTYEFILSPEDAKKCETDLAFVTSLINSQKSNIPATSGISLGTSDTSNDLLSCLEESDPEDQIQSWTEAPTKLLITLYNNLSAKVGKTFKLKSKKKMWEAIKIEMEKQCKENWGRELAECLVKNPSVFPEFTLGTKGEGKETTTMIKDSGLNLEEPDENGLMPSTPSSSKKAKIDEKQTPTTSPKAQGQGVAIELKILRLLKEANHNEKLLAYKERTAEIKRKNDLLEKLISSFEK